MKTLRVLLIETDGTTDTHEVDFVAADLDAGVRMADQQMLDGWRLKSIRVFSDEPPVGKPSAMAVQRLPSTDFLLSAKQSRPISPW